MTRIQSKITLIYVVLTFVVVASVGTLSSFKMESYFKERMVANLSNRALSMWFLLTQGPAVSFEELDHRLKELARLAELRITLIAPDGTVVADTDVPSVDLATVENHLMRPEVQTALREGIGGDTRHSSTVGKDFLYVARLVEKRPPTGLLRQVAFIRLSVHLEEIQMTSVDIRFNIFAAGLVVLLVVVGVSMFISRRISKPMVEIAQKVKEIRAGNLETRIDITTNDETSEVARAVNELVDKLKADIVQLKKLERVRSEFLGNVSHELRTPIFSLQGFLETLIEGAIDDPKVNREFLRKAYAHASRLNTLLGDLITISQIESGEMKMSFRYFGLNEFLSSIVKEFQSTAEHNNVLLRFDTSRLPEIEVLGDRERLQVVLENLIENAIKYNRAGGEVVVSFTRRNAGTKISVSDTGVGIAREHLSRIFERFYRVDRDRSREVGGTGLGLAIVKHIIEAHGSSVKVQSEPGKGSTFSFELKT
ncbi:MAG: HAMP domain-containing protein [Ignavibacteriae bacterium]|nr:HAMP domain-containing protein [Ignavibacteriota bacterium]